MLLYIIRRTFGFKRESDTISLSQMLTGIHTRDGRVLDRGVGLSKKTLLDALRNLSARRIILTQRRQSAEKGNEPTAYRLNVLRPGGTPPSYRRRRPPLGEFLHPPWGRTCPKGEGRKVPQALGGETPPHKTQGDKTKSHKRQNIILKLALRSQPRPTEHTLAPTDTTSPEATGAGDDDALSLLLSQGVTRRIAQELVRTHPREAIEQQVAWQALPAPGQEPGGGAGAGHPGRLAAAPGVAGGPGA